MLRYLLCEKTDAREKRQSLTLPVTDRLSPFTLDPREEQAGTAASCNEESGTLLINLVCVYFCVFDLVISSALLYTPFTNEVT